MSDTAIKSAFPEFQAPNVALASAMDMVVLQKHELTGMRLPKGFTGKRISRFPINDIANFSSLSNVDNVSKTVYASTQGYRKKLGSSNIDREDRQSTGKFKLNERMNPNKYSENFELKRRGGFVDLINADSVISQEDIIPYLKQVKQKDITFMNKQVRDSQVGLAKVESNLNSAVLSNLENAKANAIIQQNENKLYLNRKQKIEQYGQAAGLDATQIAILQTRMKIFKTVEIGKIQDEINKIKAMPPQITQLQSGGTSIQRKIEKVAQASGLDAAQLAILQSNLSSNPKPTVSEIQAEIKNILTSTQAPPPPPQTPPPPPPQTPPPPPQTQTPAQAPTTAPAQAPTTAPAPLTKKQKERINYFEKASNERGLDTEQKKELEIFISNLKNDDVKYRTIKDEAGRIKNASKALKGKAPATAPAPAPASSSTAPAAAPAPAPATAPAYAPTPTYGDDTQHNKAIEEHLPPSDYDFD
jgi:hypothetical protein